jgi:membrane-associated phospholipid phosphatase
VDAVRWLHGALGGPETLWLAITHLGSEQAFIVVLALYWWLFGPQVARQLGITFAIGVIVNAALKVSFDAPRPFVSDPSLVSSAAQATAPGGSMPSGHAQLVATVWGAIALQVRRAWFSCVAAVLIALVALSRMVLGVHFLSDVVVGLLLGAVTVAVGLRARYPAQPWVWLPALAAAPFLPDFASGLGLLAAVGATRTVFAPPATWRRRALTAAVGVVAVLGVFFAFRVLPAHVRREGWAIGLRTFLVALTATEIVPRMLRRLGILHALDTAPIVRAA